MNQRDHPSSKIATHIAGLGLILMITHSAQQQFQNRSTELKQLPTSSWKIVQFDYPTEVTASVLGFRTGEYRLTIYDRFRRSFEFNCRGFNEFCQGLDQQRYTPTQFEFYATHDAKQSIEHSEQYKLKRIIFLDQQQNTQSLDILHQAPNSAQYVNNKRNSLIRFFFIYGLIYSVLCIALVIYALANKQQARGVQFYLYCLIALLLILHYLYFAFSFWIQL